MEKTIIVDGKHSFVVHNNTIRVMTPPSAMPKAYEAGQIPILSLVTVALGEEFSVFLDTLDLTTLPLILKKVSGSGKFESYDIIITGVPVHGDVALATLMVYDDIIVGVTYNKNASYNKELKSVWKLSALHYLKICKATNSDILYNVTHAISRITQVDRDRLIASYKGKYLRVKVPCRNDLGIPCYYSMELDNNGVYRLLSIGFDLNDAATKINVLFGK